MMSYNYPGSRFNGGGACEMCRGTHGSYQKSGVLLLSSADGEMVKLLHLTCDYCGHTILLDPSVMKRTPYMGDGQELAPEFIKQLLD